MPLRQARFADKDPACRHCQQGCASASNSEAMPCEPVTPFNATSWARGYTANCCLAQASRRCATSSTWCATTSTMPWLLHIANLETEHASNRERKRTPSSNKDGFSLCTLSTSSLHDKEERKTICAFSGWTARPPWAPTWQHPHGARCVDLFRNLDHTDPSVSDFCKCKPCH